jgi:hypothetical protein
MLYKHTFRQNLNGCKWKKLDIMISISSYLKFIPW